MKKVFFKKAYLFYFLTACVTMLPLICGSDRESGILREWMERGNEFSEALLNGRFLLFPTEELLQYVGQVRAMNSNLWLALPALISAITGKPAWGWKCYMIFISVSTLLTAIFFFERLFEESDKEHQVFFGVLLYMTCPYRMYICYELADMAQAAVWALLPLYLGAMLGLIRGRRIAMDLVTAALALAGMAYADLTQMLIVAGVTLLTVLCMRKPLPLLSLAGGSVLALPCLLRLADYLFRGAYAAIGIPVQSIMEKGYVFGEFFSVFAYREGHPGIGPGLLAGLLAAAWLIFVREPGSRRESAGFSAQTGCVCFTALGGAFSVMALQSFPWEYVQRLGEWALKLVSLLETPAVFFGLAQACLCVPGAWAIGQMEKQPDRAVALGMPLMALAACLGICVYQCVRWI